jgi:hypothetical protein
MLAAARFPCQAAGITVTLRDFGGPLQLRCIRGGLGSPFKKGTIYDVAEILEIPWHVMVRKPNGQWPKPGELWFCWHPEEWFASPPNGLDILTCGYFCQDMFWYGVVIPGSRLKRFKRFDLRLDRVIRQTHGFKYALSHERLTPTCLPVDFEPGSYVLGAEHANLGQETPYRAAAQAIKRVLVALGMPDLRSKIGNVMYECWEKYRTRKPERLTWRNRPDG